MSTLEEQQIKDKDQQEKEQEKEQKVKEKVPEKVGISDRQIVCKICSLKYSKPYILPCSHTFCKECIKKTATIDKITCATCSKSHAIVKGATIDQIIRKDEYAEFLLKLKTDDFPKATEDELKKLNGICTVCNPPQPQDPKKPKPPPSEKVELSVCFHCDVVMCEKCRRKHYTEVKEYTKKTLNSIEDQSEGTKKKIEKINERRNQRIKNYGKMKTTIQQKHEDFIRQLKAEEQKLQQQTDKNIESEQKKIGSSVKDIETVKTNLNTARLVKDKIINEADEKKMATIYLQLKKAEQQWKQHFNKDMEGAIPAKETIYTFNAGTVNEAMLGKLAKGEENPLDDPRPTTVPKPQVQESGVCVIL